MYVCMYVCMYVALEWFGERLSDRVSATFVLYPVVAQQIYYINWKKPKRQC
jgi:hypothetical protein